MGADLVHGNPRGGKLTSGGTESLFLAVQVARDHARTRRGASPSPRSWCPRPPTRRSPRRATTSTSPRCGCRSAPTAGPTSPPPPPRSTSAPRSSSARRPATRTASSTRSPSWRRWRRSGARCATSTPASAAGCCRSSSGWASRCRRGTSGSTGVTSLSADIHKYGWCFKGASLLLHRDEDLLPLPVLPLRRLARRPLRLGHHRRHPAGRPHRRGLGDDQPPRPRRLPAPGRRGARRRPAACAPASRPSTGLRITGDPVPGVMEIAADDGRSTSAAVADVMDDRGWHLDRQQGGLHAIVSPSHVAGGRRLPRRPGRRGGRPTARAGASRPATAASADRWRRPAPGDAVRRAPSCAAGASRRMGRDKALLAVDGRPMAVRVADGAGAAGRRAGASRSAATPRRSPAAGLAVSPDREPGRGPARRHRHRAWRRRRRRRGRVVFVASCDLVAPVGRGRRRHGRGPRRTRPAPTWPCRWSGAAASGCTPPGGRRAAAAAGRGVRGRRAGGPRGGGRRAACGWSRSPVDRRPPVADADTPADLPARRAGRCGRRPVAGVTAER